jgi:hypothetical protein
MAAYRAGYNPDIERLVQMIMDDHGQTRAGVDPSLIRNELIVNKGHTFGIQLAHFCGGRSLGGSYDEAAWRCGVFGVTRRIYFPPWERTFPHVRHGS